MSAVVGGSVACFVLRVVETHQYLFFRKRGSIRSSLLFLLGGGWSAGARISLSVGSFSPYVRGGKKVLAVASAGHHLNSRWCGPDITVVDCRVARSIYLRRCGVDRDLSIETAPGGCDDARINLHYGSMKGGGVINVHVTHPRSRGSACLSKMPVPLTGTSAGESTSCDIVSCGLTA